VGRAKLYLPNETETPTRLFPGHTPYSVTAMGPRAVSRSGSCRSTLINGAIGTGA
jgi:hypothetical protein